MGKRLLNHQEPTPLYIQLKRGLLDLLNEGALQPGQSIPSERLLCAKYHISRTTVRQALSDMINEGLLQRKQGKGTFVAEKKVNQGLVRFVNFERTVLELGLKPSTIIIENEVLPADIQKARILEIPVTSQIVRLSLLGMGDHDPLVLYESFFQLLLGKKIAGEAVQLEKKRLPFSTYDLYGKTVGVSPKSVLQTFEAIGADARLAFLLKVKRGTPIFMITSIFQTSDRRPLEFRKAMYRGDRYKFHITREFS